MEQGRQLAIGDVVVIGDRQVGYHDNGGHVEGVGVERVGSREVVEYQDVYVEFFLLTEILSQ